MRVAAKAVIINSKGEVLLLREANTYKDGTNVGRYHFPGGRLDPGESYEDGLRREAKEETGLEVKPANPIYVGEWRPVIQGVPHQIIAIFTLCDTKSTDVNLSFEHDDFRWVNPKKYDIDVMPPDDKVLETYANSKSHK